MKILLILIMSISLWANIGNIMAISGDADVQRGAKELVAKSGMVLLEGDKIATSAKTRVQVMLKDSTVVTIGSNSLFGFDEFLFDGSKNSKVKMNAVRGFFRSVTGKISKVAPKRFKVKTVSATIGIRGTDFSAEIFDDKEVIKCFDGKIEVEVDGFLSEVGAGMLIEVVANKTEVRKIDEKISATTKKEVVVKAIEGAPSEIMNEITQIVEENIKDGKHHDDNKPSKVEEPFTIEPHTQDREVKY